MINKVILVGRLGRDPETRFTNDGSPVCTFSMATDETWRSKDGQKQQRTEWHNIVVFGRLAEICQQYLKKGQLTYIEGRIQSRKYTGKDGIERTAYDIVTSDMKMLGSRRDNDGYSPFPDSSEAYGQTSNAAPSSIQTPPAPPQETPMQPQAPKSPAPSNFAANMDPEISSDGLEDDIPF